MLPAVARTDTPAWTAPLATAAASTAGAARLLTTVALAANPTLAIVAATLELEVAHQQPPFPLPLRNKFLLTGPARAPVASRARALSLEIVARSMAGADLQPIIARLVARQISVLAPKRYISLPSRRFTLPFHIIHLSFSRPKISEVEGV